MVCPGKEPKSPMAPAEEKGSCERPSSRIGPRAKEEVSYTLCLTASGT